MEPYLIMEYAVSQLDDNNDPYNDTWWGDLTKEQIDACLYFVLSRPVQEWKSPHDIDSEYSRRWSWNVYNGSKYLYTLEPSR
jgi:hypothetical protein